LKQSASAVVSTAASSGLPVVNIRIDRFYEVVKGLAFLNMLSGALLVNITS